MSKSKGEHIQAVQMAAAMLVQRPDLQPEKVKYLFAKLGNLKPQVDATENKINETRATLNGLCEKRSMLMGSFEAIMDLISDAMTDDELDAIIKAVTSEPKKEEAKDGDQSIK